MYDDFFLFRYSLGRLSVISRSSLAMGDCRCRPVAVFVRELTGKNHERYSETILHLIYIIYTHPMIGLRGR